METMILKSGYANDKTTAEYRPMTIEEAKLLTYGQHVVFQDVRGQARNIKVNGQPRTWKRDSNRVEVPAKYGMYEYATFSSRDDGTMRSEENGSMLLVRV
jgi:hypothetical protein